MRQKFMRVSIIVMLNSQQPVTWGRRKRACPFFYALLEPGPPARSGVHG